MKGKTLITSLALLYFEAYKLGYFLYLYLQQVQWKKLLVKTTIWLAVEIFLNFVGLDTLADYDEFFVIAFMHREQSLIYRNNLSEGVIFSE